MQIIHFYLKLNQNKNNYVELPYFENNPNIHQSRSLHKAEVADLIHFLFPPTLFPPTL